MRDIIISLMCLFISNANALDFHYGNRSVPLTTVKHTTPSLNVRDADGSVHYGALFNANNYAVPQNVVHIRDYDGVEYFLSPWCDAGYYPSSETNECIPCGYGHFCAGGNHRESCTYGIIACNTKNNTFDPPMPAGTDGMYNRALTRAEVNQYVPLTDISDWGKEASVAFNSSIPCNTSVNDPVFEPRDKEIERGTYLVMHHHCGPDTTTSSAISGSPNCAESAYIVVFDHSVIYRPISVCSHIGNYFDTLHIPYVAYDLKLPDDDTSPFPYTTVNENITNINNIQSAAKADVFLYELK